MAAGKASLALEKEQSLEQVSSPVSSAHSSLAVVTNPASSYLSFGSGPADLEFRSSAFFASGSALPMAAAFSNSSSGMQSFIVPSFVNTFSTPVSSTPAAASLFRALPSVSTIFSIASATPVASPGLFSASEVVPSLLVLHQPFVVGPGFSSVPAKTVSQIVSGKFVDFSDLLPANIAQSESEPQLLFDGRMIVSSNPKRSRDKVDDIVT